MASLFVGSSGTSYPISGRLDQLRIYDRPLPYDDPAQSIDIRRLHAEGKHIYFANLHDGDTDIISSDIDGTSLTPRVFVGTGNGTARDLLVRPDLGYIYWSNITTRAIERAPLDGGTAEVLFDAAASANYQAFETVPLIHGFDLSQDGTVSW
jgi:hypothetical protein